MGPHSSGFSLLKFTQRQTKDLAGYGTSQFSEKDVHQMAGFSDKSFALMAQLREDPRALVTRIKQVEFSDYVTRSKKVSRAG